MPSKIVKLMNRKLNGDHPGLRGGENGKVMAKGCKGCYARHIHCTVYFKFPVFLKILFIYF